MDIQTHVPLAPLTTFKTGGAAALCVVVTTEAELTAALAYAHAEALAVTVLGGGSNVLVPDAGVLGLTILMRIEGEAIEQDGSTVRVTVGAGVELDRFIARCVSAGWWGLENLSAIPGSVGATPIQNVGAYGVEAGEVIQSVRAFDRETAQFTELSASACQFGYRDSLFKHADGRYVVTAVTYRLSTEPRPRLSYRDLAAHFGADPTPSLAAIRAAVTDIRSRKFPDWHTVGTAGSFFKNPIIPRSQYESLQGRYPDLPYYPVSDGTVKVPLGWILDHVLGVRGEGTATVGTYREQALVVVNRGGASTTDVLHFTDTLADHVFRETGIAIEREVTLLTAVGSKTYPHTNK